MAHSDSGSMWGLKSSTQAALFGLACAALGAVAATLCWASLELDTAVSPRLVSTKPVAHIAAGSSGPKKGLFGQVAGAKSCDCDHCSAGATVAHNHQCDDCVFCKARAKKAALVTASPSVPIHRRPGYRAHSPDILFITVTHSENSAAADKQPIVGEHLVRADGKINLGTWGELNVEGKTVDEIRQAVEQLVDAAANGSFVEVSVFAQNSKVYYVVEEGMGMADRVRRFPIVGNETALDALCQVGRMNDLSRKKLWIARPVVGGPDTIIPVSWQFTSPTTIVANNPSLQPGDRVFVQTPSTWMAFIDEAVTLAYAPPREKQRHENASAVKPAEPGYSSPK